MKIIAPYIDREKTTYLLERERGGPSVIDHHINTASRLGVGESYAVEPKNSYPYKSRVQNALNIKLRTNVCLLPDGKKARLVTRVA